jgi:uncharacterized protein
MKFSEEVLAKVKAESYVSKKVKMQEINGQKGLFAIDKISKNEIVSISGGVILSKKEYEIIYKNTSDHAYSITEDFLICPLNPENPSDDWRMNHCCEPNCGVKGQIVFVAMKEIEIGEELTFDYAMTETDPNYSFDLSCKNKSCRKKFTGSDYKLKQVQEKCKGYFSLYVQDKIEKLEGN